ncbi:acylneuraminate cytidylyltransferase family protein [uncultured Clostridium sp.]|uniref:acylneuraminate cytidylyltransferase family protein n=1 Tax=uncultured Clostridium sp. TaxID=59620 RepID=UPI0028E78276|nr:acylneuraminate cytidylyltransferase family protein [uncultured Clostridium sp.]
MYKNKTFLAVIPARGGSKGIPKKNIIQVNDRPLIDYTITEVLKSKHIDRVIVSTDSQEIADISKKCGADVPFTRPNRLAKDESKTIDVIIDLLNKLSRQDENYDYLIILQPTQPLRKAFHIDEAIALMVDNKLQSLVSVNEVKENPVLMRTFNSGNELERVLKINSTLRRQEFPKYYKVNGAIYINKIDENLNLKTSLNDNKYAYIMDKKYDLDIDEPFDLEILKLKLKDY